MVADNRVVYSSLVNPPKQTDPDVLTLLSEIDEIAAVVEQAVVLENSVVDLKS